MPIRTLIVLRSEHSTGDRLEAEQGEEPPRYQMTFGSRFDAALHAHIQARCRIRRKFGEHGRFRLKLAELAVTEAGRTCGLMAGDEVQLLGVCDRKRAEQHRVDECEDRRVGPDSQRQ